MRAETIPIDAQDKRAVLKTYLLDDYPKYYQQQKRPAVVICPGGGYTRLARKEGEPVALKMNTMGYHAFVLEYSVILAERPESHLEKDSGKINPHGYFPVQLRQLQRVIRMIQEQADAWNVDEKQIVLMGFSAGGHLAASYLTYGKELLGTDYIKPKAAVLGYARTNMAVPDWKEKFDDADSRITTRYKYLCQFRTETPTEAQKLEIDPWSHIHADMPPVFLWHSIRDRAVNALSAITFAQRLFETGVPVELHLFAGGVHGCALADQVCASEKEHYHEGCQMWTKLLQIWLSGVLEEESREKMERNG